MVKLLKKVYALHISKYIIVGVLNTIVGYSVYSFLILSDIKYVFALLISHVAGVTNSYFWNKYYTFKSVNKSWHELKRFIFIYILYFLEFNFYLAKYIIKADKVSDNNKYIRFASLNGKVYGNYS